jgi:hypothetical protein
MPVPPNWLALKIASVMNCVPANWTRSMLLSVAGRKSMAPL